MLAAVGAGLVWYLGLCLLSVGVGLGLQRLLRLPLARGDALLFAPALTLALWGVGLGLLEARLLPGRLAAWPLWAITLLLLLVGVQGLRATWRAEAPLASAPASAARARRLRATLGGGEALGLLGLAVVLPVLALWPLFGVGLLDAQGTVWPDGWSYAALGRYLWDYGRTADGGLAPIYQYAAHLNGTRYISSALLGFLSPLVAVGDPRAVASLFQAWTVFVFGATCALVIRAWPVGLPLRAAYLALAVGSGWAANVIYANNYDNSAALACLPALVATAARFKPTVLSWCAVLSLLGAASLYTYPELVPFVLGGAGLLFAQRVWQERGHWRTWLAALAASTFLALVLTAPFLREAVSFLLAQSNVGLSAGARPGEGMFSGLLPPDYRWGAFWGLGTELIAGRWHRLQQLAGMELAALALLGWLRLLWCRQLAMAALLAGLVAACLVMLLRNQYSYGAYKLIALGWWGYCLLVVLGVALIGELLARLTALRPAGRRALTVALAVALAAVPLGFNLFLPRSVDGRRTPYVYEELRTHDFQAVTGAAAAAGDAPILVATQHDVLAEWALYYLNDISLALGTLPRYLAQPHLQPYLARMRTVAPADVRYVLTDTAGLAERAGAEAWPLRWVSEPYRLREPPAGGWAALTEAAGPLPLEQVNGEPWLWLGSQPYTLRLYAARDGQATLQLTQGPLARDVAPTARLEFGLADGTRLTVAPTDGTYTATFALQAGLNAVTLSLLDPAPAATPGVDRLRQMGVTAPRLAFAP